MIKSITLKNFFSFHNLTINLEQLNVLVGINGVGKTNFMKAIRLLKSVVTEGALSDLVLNQWGGFDAVCFCGSGCSKTSRVEIEYRFDERVLQNYGYHFLEPVYYKISLKKVSSSQNFSVFESLYTKSEDGEVAYKYLQLNEGKGFVKEGERTDNQHSVQYQLDSVSESIFSHLVDKDRYLQCYTIREAIKDIAVYSNFDISAQSTIRKPMLPSGVLPRLTEDGSNLPQILNRIKINTKSGYQGFLTALKSVNPNYNGIDFNFVGTNFELMLDEDKLEHSIHVTHISDGTLRYMCLLAIAFNTQRGGLICIDEPEIGLHPDMISEFMSGIIKASEQSQFIMSTHSEHILNEVSVSNVLVCEKDEENATSVAEFKDEEFVAWASNFSAGRLWRNGDLGGNRY